MKLNLANISSSFQYNQSIPCNATFKLGQMELLKKAKAIRCYHSHITSMVYMRCLKPILVTIGHIKYILWIKIHLRLLGEINNCLRLQDSLRRRDIFVTNSMDYNFFFYYCLSVVKCCHCTFPFLECGCSNCFILHSSVYVCPVSSTSMQYHKASFTSLKLHLHHL